MTAKQGNALIVGAGDYIGAAIAKRLAAEGMTVALGRRNGDKLEPLVEEIRSAGGQAHGYSFDARDEQTVEERFAEIESSLGPLDLVIYNVGGNVHFPLLETTARVYRKVWEMCALGGFLVGREAAKYMTERGRGKIFFTGATASLRGGSGYAAFSGGKFALRALAQAMARELGPQNIHVAHLVIDAPVDTEFVRGRIAAAGHDPDALPEDALMNPDSIANMYWQLYQQSRDAWTHELDIRPWGEKW